MGLHSKENDSAAQRPRRAASFKGEVNLQVGLHLTEKQALRKALLASLAQYQEEKKKRPSLRSPPRVVQQAASTIKQRKETTKAGGVPAVNSGSVVAVVSRSAGELKATRCDKIISPPKPPKVSVVPQRASKRIIYLREKEKTDESLTDSTTEDESSERSRYRAQRKFAQGCALPVTPASLPLPGKQIPPSPAKSVDRASSTASSVVASGVPSTATTSVRTPAIPKEPWPLRNCCTEDFLTFLCFRATNLCPPSLQFFADAPLHPTGSVGGAYGGSGQRGASVGVGGSKSSLQTSRRESITSVESGVTTSDNARESRKRVAVPVSAHSPKKVASKVAEKLPHRVARVERPRTRFFATPVAQNRAKAVKSKYSRLSAVQANARDAKVKINARAERVKRRALNSSLETSPTKRRGAKEQPQKTRKLDENEKSESFSSSLRGDKRRVSPHKSPLRTTSDTKNRQTAALSRARRLLERAKRTGSNSSLPPKAVACSPVRRRESTMSTLSTTSTTSSERRATRSLGPIQELALPIWPERMLQKWRESQQKRSKLKRQRSRALAVARRRLSAVSTASDATSRSESSDTVGNNNRSRKRIAARRARTSVKGLTSAAHCKDDKLRLAAPRLDRFSSTETATEGEDHGLEQKSISRRKETGRSRVATAAPVKVARLSEAIAAADDVASLDAVAAQIPLELASSQERFDSDLQQMMTSKFLGDFDSRLTANEIVQPTRQDPGTQLALTMIRHELGGSVNSSPTKQLTPSSTSTTPQSASNSSSLSMQVTPVVVLSPLPSESSPVTTASSVIIKRPQRTTSAAAASTSGAHTSTSILSTATTSSTKHLVSHKQTDLAASTNKTSSSRSMSVRQRSKMAHSVETAPTFEPTAEEFSDPIAYLKKIQSVAERYGVCLIKPPSTFSPELKVTNDMRFTAHNQSLHKMLNRYGPNALLVECLRKAVEVQGTQPFTTHPVIGGIELDLAHLFQTVQNFGGIQQVIEKKKWIRVADAMHIPRLAHDRVARLDDAYMRHCLPYETLLPEERAKMEASVLRDRSRNRSLNLQPCVVRGRSMSLSVFDRIARNTRSMWYNDQAAPDEVERDYWGLVEGRKRHVVVHAGNIDTSAYQCGFQVGKSISAGKHPWNLKVFTQLPDNVLGYLGPVSGVTTPTLHVSMLFTTGCWHRDPHALPWIDYLHTGAPKIWYGVGGKQVEQFHDALPSEMRDADGTTPKWIPSDSVMMPPHMLLEQDVSVSRVVQTAGTFAVVWPGAYAANVSCGASIAESVYFATTEWLATATQRFQELRESSEPPTFPLERLLLNIADRAAEMKLDVLTAVIPALRNFVAKEISLRAQLQEQHSNLRKEHVARLRDPTVIASSSSASSSATSIASMVSASAEQADDAENIVADDIECEECRTICYVSMVTVTGSSAIYCLTDATTCLPKKKAVTIYYTRTTEELTKLLDRVDEMVEAASKKR